MLQLCLKNNAYGEMELSLYTRTRVGTKVLLEEYRDEVCRSLRALAQYQPPSGSAIAHARREFGMAARASFGGCALVLSGRHYLRHLPLWSRQSACRAQAAAAGRMRRVRRRGRRGGDMHA